MKREPGWDPELPFNARKPWPTISRIALFLTLTAAGACWFGITRGGTQQPTRPIKPVRPGVVMPTGVVPSPLQPATALDHFVRIADTSIDPEMVIPPPPDLDQAMVVNAPQ
jgi:hypothetical protein